MKFPPFASLAALCATLAPLCAQNLPGLNPDSILREIEQIEARQKAAKESVFQTTIAKLRSAASNPRAAVELYQQAVEAIEFEGRDNKAAQFADWKAGMADALRSSEAETVLMIHLRYLVLSLERGATKDPRSFVTPSLTYAQSLPGIEEMFRKLEARGKSEKSGNAIPKIQNLKKEFLDQSVKAGIFARWMRLGPWLPKEDRWEMAPGNLGGILEKNVRPFLRDEKSAQIVETWDLEMRVLADRATAAKRDREADEFNLITLPRMQFQRANDMIAVGLVPRGITEIYTLAKNNPQHPDFPAWAARLRELLKTTAPVEPAGAPPAELPSTP